MNCVNCRNFSYSNLEHTVDYSRCNVKLIAGMSSGSPYISVVYEQKWLKFCFRAHFFKMFWHSKFQLSIIFTFRVIILLVDESVISVKLSYFPGYHSITSESTSDGELKFWMSKYLEKMCLETKFQPFLFINNRDIGWSTWRSCDPLDVPPTVMVFGSHHHSCLKEEGKLDCGGGIPVWRVIVQWQAKRQACHSQTAVLCKLYFLTQQKLAIVVSNTVLWTSHEPVHVTWITVMATLSEWPEIFFCATVWPKSSSTRNLSSFGSVVLEKSPKKHLFFTFSETPQK